MENNNKSVDQIMAETKTQLRAQRRADMTTSIIVALVKGTSSFRYDQPKETAPRDLTHLIPFCWTVKG